MFVINFSFILLLSVTVITSVNIRQRDLQSVIADKNLVVMIEDENKAQYLEQNFNKNTYKFGYEVGSDGQFHHENRGPNGITYGCYGHIDPNKNLQATHYVADSYGYRVIEPNDPIIVYRQLNNDDVSKEVHNWSESYFPRGCGNFVSSFRFPASLSTTNGNELGNIGQSNKPDHITLDVFGKPVNVNYNSYGGFNSKKVNSYDYSVYKVNNDAKVNNKPVKKFDRTRFTSYHHNNQNTYFDNSDSTKLMKNGVHQVQVASNYQAGQNDNWSLRKNDKHKNNILSILNDSEDDVLPISKKPYSNNLVVLTGQNIYKINDNMKYSKGVQSNVSATNKFIENYNIKTNAGFQSKFIVKKPFNDNDKYGEYTKNNGDQSKFFSNTDKKTGAMSPYQNSVKNGEISNDNVDNYNNQFGNKILGQSKIVDKGENIFKNVFNVKSNLRPLVTQTDSTPIKNDVRYGVNLGGDVLVNLKSPINLTASPDISVFEKNDNFHDKKHGVYLGVGGDVSVNLKSPINLTGSPYVTVFDKNNNFNDNSHGVNLGGDVLVNLKSPVNLTGSPDATVFDKNNNFNDNSHGVNFGGDVLVNLKSPINLTGSHDVTVFDKNDNFNDKKHGVYLGGDVSVNLNPSVNLIGSPYVTVFDKNNTFNDNSHGVNFGGDVSVNLKSPVNLTASPDVTVFEKNDNFHDKKHGVYLGGDVSVNLNPSVNLTGSPYVTVFDKNNNFNDNSHGVNFEGDVLVNLKSPINLTGSPDATVFDKNNNFNDNSHGVDLGGDVLVNLNPSVNLTSSPDVSEFDKNNSFNDNRHWVYLGDDILVNSKPLVNLTVFDKNDNGDGHEHGVYSGGDVLVNIKPPVNLTGSPYVTVFDKNENYGDNMHEAHFGDNLSVNAKPSVNLTGAPFDTVFHQNTSMVNNFEFDNHSQTTVRYFEENENVETESNLNVGSTVLSPVSSSNAVENDKEFNKHVVDIPLEHKIKSSHITTIDKWFDTIKYSEHDGIQPQLPSPPVYSQPEVNDKLNDEIVEIKGLANEDLNVTSKPEVGCNVLCLQQNYKFLNKTILWNSLNQFTNMKSNETELNAIQKVILLQPIVLLPYCQDDNDEKLFDLNAVIPLLQNQSYAKIPYECARCNKSDL